MSVPVFESKAAYDVWIKLLLGSVVFIVLMQMLFLGQMAAEDLYIMAGTILFIGIVYWLVLPRSYRIYNDHVSIVLGWPCSITVNFSTIRSVEKPKGVVFGVNFACSSRNTIAINRKKRLTVHISPVESGLFLTNLENSLQEWRKYYDKSN